MIAPGPWMATLNRGYDAYKRPWIITRRNPKWFGGTETLCGSSASPRRFATESAADTAATKLNQGATK